MFEELKKIDTGMGSTLGDYKFLYGFVSMIRPKTIVEIGTNCGGSAVAMAMALRDAGLTKSRIVSIDINKGYLEIARNQLKKLGLLKYVFLRHGNSSLVYDYASFDMAFIDGDHTYEGCLADFHNLKNKTTYVLIHDSAQNEGVSKAVENIERMKSYKVFNLDIGEHGPQWSLGKPVYNAYPGISLVTKRKDAKGITGIVLVDHYTAQTWSAITMLTKFFSDNRDVKRVVDIGTGTGGLTLLFGLNMLQRDGKVLSLDIEETQSAQARRDFEKLNITFEKADAFQKDVVDLVQRFIKGERALIFCDNGCKPREFALYTRILKEGDFIMAHDWRIEITPLDLDRQTLSMLEPYLQEEFDREETYILSMKRVSNEETQ